jgi:hypothetical protein
MFKVGDKVRSNVTGIEWEVEAVKNDIQVKDYPGWHPSEIFELVNTPKFKVGDWVKWAHSETRFEVVQTRPCEFALKWEGVLYWFPQAATTIHLTTPPKKENWRVFNSSTFQYMQKDGSFSKASTGNFYNNEQEAENALMYWYGTKPNGILQIHQF